MTTNEKVYLRRGGRKKKGGDVADEVQGAANSGLSTATRCRK